AKPLWEPSLLAMAAVHPTSMQADPPLSRAGSLPQGMVMNTLFARDAKPLWEPSLLAMAAVHPTSMRADPPLLRAGSLPQGNGAEDQHEDKDIFQRSNGNL
ncbi:hypothetical protein ACCT23_23905, partial [Pseudomonas corrugata]